MKKRHHALTSLLVALLASAPFAAQEGAANAPKEKRTYSAAAGDVQARLEAAQKELEELRESIAATQLPMSKKLGELESEMLDLERDFNKSELDLNSRKLAAANLKKRIDALEETNRYLSETLIAEYIREFKSRLHISEDQLYEERLQAAEARISSGQLSELEVLEAQAGLIDLSLDRLEDVLGGSRFDGEALDAGGLVNQGTFVMVGPVVLFRSSTSEEAIGLVEQKIGSLQPSLVPYVDETLAPVAAGLVADGSGTLPFDPTLGDATKVLQTEQETLLDEIEKGGFVIWPILGMASLALLIALWKWLTLTLVPMPSRRRVNELLESLGGRDREVIGQRAKSLRGPLGKMLQAGVDHLREPRDLIEEVMYERVLTTRFKLQSLLPFIAICAASAPLLGLLGTVTGIIETFKTITIQGTGNVKSLSGGISEALITTKFGLIVAIPSLLLHALLARKARGMIARMETTAVAFANRVSRSPWSRSSGTGTIAPGVPDPDLVRAQVSEILSDMLGPVAAEGVLDVTHKAPVVTTLPAELEVASDNGSNRPDHESDMVSSGDTA